MAFALTGLAACGGSSGGVVASVGGMSITKTSLDHWMALEAALDPNGTSSKAQLQARVLTFLISAQWTLGEAHELGIAVSGAKVKRETELLKLEQQAVGSIGDIPRGRELTRLLSSSRIGFSDQVWAVKLSMLDARIQQLRVTQIAKRITRAQVEAYYKHHQPSFHVLEHRYVGIIESFQKSAMQKAKREIQAGKSFAEVAKRVSIDPLARDGTFELPSNQGAKALREAIFGAKLHVLVGPLRVSSYYLFEVLRITPAHELSLKQVEHQIIHTLAVQRASTIARIAYERKWVSRTICEPGYAMSGCRASKSG